MSYIGLQDRVWRNLRIAYIAFSVGEIDFSYLFLSAQIVDKRRYCLKGCKELIENISRYNWNLFLIWRMILGRKLWSLEQSDLFDLRENEKKERRENIVCDEIIRIILNIFLVWKKIFESLWILIENFINITIDWESIHPPVIKLEKKIQDICKILQEEKKRDEMHIKK